MKYIFVRTFKKSSYIFLFLVCFHVSSWAQISADESSGYVMSEDGEGIPFAAIYLKNKNIGIIADIDGRYILPSSILSETGDTLIFSSIGYESQSIPVSVFNEKVNKNIVLRTNYVQLPEVVVTPRSRRPRDYGMFHLRTASVYFGGEPSSRIMVFVENTDNVHKLIQSINIRTRFSNAEIQKLRVFFAQKTDDGFQIINVADEDIFITDISRSRIRHGVSNYYIPFPEEGIYVGIEIIGEANVVQDRTRRLGFAIRGTTNANKPNTWFFKNEVWVQHPVETVEEIEKELEGVPRAFRRMIMNTIFNSNAMIGITAH